MVEREEVQRFLEQFHTKMKVFGILYRDDRDKNRKTDNMYFIPFGRKSVEIPF
jgi:hypothetical protein